MAFNSWQRIILGTTLLLQYEMFGGVAKLTFVIERLLMCVQSKEEKALR